MIRGCRHPSATARSNISRPREWLWLIAVALAAVVPGVDAGDFASPVPQAFEQEIARHREWSSGLPGGTVALVDHDGQTLRAFVAGRWHALQDGRWREAVDLTTSVGQQFQIAGTDGQPVSLPVSATTVRQILRIGPRLWALTDNRVFEVNQVTVRSFPVPVGAVPRQLAGRSDGELWLATSTGLVRLEDGDWKPVLVGDGSGKNLPIAADILGVAWDSTGAPWIATTAGVARRDTDRWRWYDETDGLPWNEFTSVTGGPAGEVWFSTRRGLIRWDGRDFHYREGPRWLPNNDVGQVAVGPDGVTWIATADGLGCIIRTPMTLAAKAEHYEAEIERCIARTPYGYVSSSRLEDPNDPASAVPQETDNDGLWTAMYGAGECFAYAATGSPAALRRAQRAFEALRFLQVVTQGGSPAPDPGFVARTILPVTAPDPNLGRLEADRSFRRHDALWKVYEPRWPRSADGQWYWKGDTSSDELDGHFFFYPLYYEFCAQTEAEKSRVREVVKALMDHLLDHDFCLVDVDGSPTRWGVFSPERLNADPNWWVERGLNSLSMLSYLAVAEYVTGEARYRDATRILIEKHGYAQNMMVPKIHQGAGSGNQSDDEMAFMCFYSLLRYSRNPELLARARLAFFLYWVGEAAELNPFFNFAYAASNHEQTLTGVWGSFSVAPWEGWLEDAAGTLRGFPLDRRNWPHRNSHRLDLVRFDRLKAKDVTDPDATLRGHRIDGRVLPVENRHFEHWNTDPWRFDYEGTGTQLASGAVFLLPYYMGLYHGFIAGE
jgi:hypothetical protein